MILQTEIQNVYLSLTYPMLLQCSETVQRRSSPVDEYQCRCACDIKYCYILYPYDNFGWLKVLEVFCHAILA